MVPVGAVDGPTLKVPRVKFPLRIPWLSFRPLLPPPPMPQLWAVGQGHGMSLAHLTKLATTPSLALHLTTLDLRDSALTGDRVGLLLEHFTSLTVLNVTTALGSF